MPCTNCKEVVEEVPATSGLPYTLMSERSVQGRDGRYYPVTACIIPRLYAPVGGWTGVFHIKGQKVLAQGNGPRVVFAAAKELFRINEIPVTDADLWFNLNIQWTDRTAVSKRNISWETLLSLSVPIPPDEQGLHEIKRWSAKDWSTKVWGFVETYLAQDFYSYPTFLVFISSLRDIFNITLNPSLGHAGCYRVMGSFTEDLTKNPIHEKAEARLFFWNLKKAVNDIFHIVTASFEETSKENHWT